MKKFILVLLSVLLCLSMFSCEGDICTSSSSEIVSETSSLDVTSSGAVAVKDEATVTIDDLQSLNMILSQTWNNGDEIGVHRYYAYYLNYINSVMTPEERNEKYPNGFPEEEFEAFIKSRFDVSTEHLRSDENTYHPETKTYHIQLEAPNLFGRVEFSDSDVSKDGEIFVVRAKYFQYTTSTTYEIREYRLKKDGDHFKYLSCVKVDNTTPSTQSGPTVADIEFLGALAFNTWENGNDIESRNFAYLFNRFSLATMSQEEREEKYTLENMPSGFYFPAEELEAFAQKYFDVSVEHLRDTPTYLSEYNVYSLGAGSNLRPQIEFSQNDIKFDGEVYKVTAKLTHAGEVEYKTFTLKKDGDHFRYLSCTKA